MKNSLFSSKITDLENRVAWRVEKRFFFFLFAAFFVALAGVNASEAFDLTTELHSTPLGIDEPTPRFSWKMKPEKEVRARSQTGYRLLVASKQSDLQEGKTDIWDSGKVESSESVLVTGLPAPVSSKKRYYWTVKIWNEKGEEGTYAAPTWFETGLLSQQEWKENQATWIESPIEPESNANMDAWLKYAVVPFENLGFYKDKPTPEDLVKSQALLNKDFKEKIFGASLLRREFNVSTDFESARLYICGLGYHRAYANGIKIGDRMLPPSDTDFATQSYYQAYDVTSLLKAGEKNCLGVELVNGRWRAWPGHTPEAYHDRPVLMARLEITKKDGSRECIVTDQSWQAGRHGIERHGFWQGEVFDSNIYPNGWNVAGFDAQEWKSVRVSAASKKIGPLRWDPMPPEKIFDRGHPVSQTEPAPKVFMYDFGMQLAGRARFTFRNLKKGQQVIVRYSTAKTGDLEYFVRPYYPGFQNTKQLPGMVLFKQRDAISFDHGPGTFLPDGTFKSVKSSLGPVVYTDLFVSAGKPVEVWQPDFTYLGFRYLEILGLDQALPVTDVMGFDLRTAPRIVGSLTTDNPKLNQVLKGVQNTLFQGFHSQLQDNNGSERNPNGLNDALNSLVTAYWFDTHPLWTKSLDNVTKISARINWPANMVSGGRNHPGNRKERYILIADCFQYGQIPLDMWGFYNDPQLIKNMIPLMHDWLKETTEYTVWNKVTAYGDHIADSSLANLRSLWGDKPKPPAMFVQAAIVIKVGNENIRLFRAMGLNDEAEKVTKVLEPFYAQVREKFYDANQSKWLPSVLTRQQINAALYAWQIDPSLDPALLASQVVDEFKTLTNGHQITGSRLSDPLLHLLTQGGQVDEALRLLEREEYPSLLNMIQETGGNIRESWGKSDSYSQIEGLTAMGNWFYRDLVGIAHDLKAPAFKHFSLKPTIPKGVNVVDFSYDSAHGMIESRFKKEAGQVQWTVTVPPNSSATITFPSSSLDQISESNKPIRSVPRMVEEKPINGRSTVRISSGTYTFRFPLN